MLVALDKLTGKVVWKTERSAVPKLANRPKERRKAYGTPRLIAHNGQTLSVSTGAERFYAYDPETGKELWYVDHPGFSNVPVPVSDGNAVYLSTGFMKPELWAIRLGDAAGDVTVLAGDDLVRRDVEWLNRYQPGWANDTAAPLFAEIAQKTVILLDIPPDSVRLQIAQP